MSGSSSGEKTEQPTQKKLRDARKKGQVAKSKDLVSTALVVSLYAYFWLNSERYITTFQKMILIPPKYYGQDFQNALRDTGHAIFILSLKLTVPVMLIVIIVAIFANYIQIGALMAPESIKPDIKKLNPGTRLKQIFSSKNMFETLKSIIKIGFLGGLITSVIYIALPSILAVPFCGVSCVLPVTGAALHSTMVSGAIGFTTIAAADFAFQKFDHIKQLKMTKDEIKKEYKEMEGNPEMKSKRRSLHQELLNSRVPDDVKRSSVIVTNPTHYAVGLMYNEGDTALPVVTVKGEGILAKRIIELAKQEGIPIMQNVPLARDLMSQVEQYNYIPGNLLEPVAEVLRVIRDLDKSNG